MKKNHFYIALTLILFSGVSAFAILNMKISANENYKNTLELKSNGLNQAKIQNSPKVSSLNNSELNSNNEIKINAKKDIIISINKEEIENSKSEIIIAKPIIAKTEPNNKVENEVKKIKSAELQSAKLEKNDVQIKAIPEKISNNEIVIVRSNKSGITNIASIDSLTKGNKITIKLPRKE